MHSTHVNKICFPLLKLKIVEISSADVMEGQAEDKTGTEEKGRLENITFSGYNS